MFMEPCAHAASTSQGSGVDLVDPCLDRYALEADQAAWDLVADFEERMHEVRSSLAALEAAMVVLTGADPDTVTAIDTGTDTGTGAATDAVRGARDDRARRERRRVEDLLRAELDRLRRLVAPSWVAEPPEVPAEIDLDDVIEQVVEARRLAGQPVEWRPSGLRVLARRDELVQVLNILLVNAARHAVGSTASIEVVHDGVATRVSVTDDGPGVPDDVRPLIFERGIRGRDSEGQGLGLSIACSLARDLGGSLTLSDRRDHGASFELLLPHAALGGAA